MTIIQWQAAIECKRADLRNLVERINTTAAVGTFYAAAGMVKMLSPYNIREKLGEELHRMIDLRAKESDLRAELAELLKARPETLDDAFG